MVKMKAFRFLILRNNAYGNPRGQPPVCHIDPERSMQGQSPPYLIGTCGVIRHQHRTVPVVSAAYAGKINGEYFAVHRKSLLYLIPVPVIFHMLLGRIAKLQRRLKRMYRIQYVLLIKRNLILELQLRFEGNTCFYLSVGIVFDIFIAVVYRFPGIRSPVIEHFDRLISLFGTGCTYRKLSDKHIPFLIGKIRILHNIFRAVQTAVKIRTGILRICINPLF